jgi:hypothetical protein
MIENLEADPQVYDGFDEEMLPTAIFRQEGTREWYWKIRHPSLAKYHVGPFETSRDAYYNMMQWGPAPKW